jgi:hypothetical protein
MGTQFSDYDRSQYLNAAAASKLDLPLRVTIESITEEQVRDPKSGQQVPKLVVRFNELDEEQSLILNKTNLRALRAKYGDEISASFGKPVILYVDQTSKGPGIRIRFPETKARKVAAQTSHVEQFAKGGKNGDGTAAQANPDDDLNDEMPF